MCLCASTLSTSRGPLLFDVLRCFAAHLPIPLLVNKQSGEWKSYASMKPLVSPQPLPSVLLVVSEFLVRALPDPAAVVISFISPLSRLEIENDLYRSDKGDFFVAELTPFMLALQGWRFWKYCSYVDPLGARKCSGRTTHLSLRLLELPHEHERDVVLEREASFLSDLSPAPQQQLPTWIERHSSVLSGVIWKSLASIYKEMENRHKRAEDVDLLYRVSLLMGSSEFHSLKVLSSSNSRVTVEPLAKRSMLKYDVPVTIEWGRADPGANASVNVAVVLRGLEYTPHLRHINLSGCTFEYGSQSIAALALCTSLRSVVIRDCRSVSSIAELATLPHLTLLDASRCRILVDLRIFEKASKLQTLLLEGNSLLGCGALRGVVHLDVSHCDLEHSDILALGTCTSLQSLNVSNNHLDMSPTELREVDGALVTTKTDSTRCFVTQLSTLVNLKTLHMKRCGTVNVSGVAAAFVSLESLSMGNFLIDHLASLRTMSTLTELEIDGSGTEQTKSINFLEGCGALRSLHLTNFDLLDSSENGLSALASLVNVEFLALVRCGLTTLQPLLGFCRSHQLWLPNVTSLDLSFNSFLVSDSGSCPLEALSWLFPQLASLNLSSSKVEDISFLQNMPADRYGVLRALSLSDNSSMFTGFESVYCHCMLEELRLCPNFQLSLAELATACPSLRRLFHIDPSPLLDPLPRFLNVEEISIFENMLTQGFSLTFHFLRKVPLVFPNAKSVEFVCNNVQEGHVELLLQNPNIRHLTLAPKQSLCKLNPAAILCGRGKRLRKLTLVVDSTNRTLLISATDWAAQLRHSLVVIVDARGNSVES